MIDWKEIPDGDTWELFARDFLVELGFVIEVGQLASGLSLRLFCPKLQHGEQFRKFIHAQHMTGGAKGDRRCPGSTPFWF